jgi:hypothetical protein
VDLARSGIIGAASWPDPSGSSRLCSTRFSYSTSFYRLKIAVIDVLAAPLCPVHGEYFAVTELDAFHWRWCERGHLAG